MELLNIVVFIIKVFVLIIVYFLITKSEYMICTYHQFWLLFITFLGIPLLNNKFLSAEICIGGGK